MVFNVIINKNSNLFLKNKYKKSLRINSVNTLLFLSSLLFMKQTTLHNGLYIYI